jgi:anaerobic magnesium-protoporphyrin IX monomethyl ester cyclase
MRILIINPPYYLPIIREGRCQSPQNMRKTSIPQMTLAYLAGVLARANHTLKVYDCIADGMTIEDVLIETNNFKPELALINTTTPSINADLLFIEALKKHCPNCFTTVFGTHVTAFHKEIMGNNPAIDCVIRNEPEWSALELSSALQNGNIWDEGISGCTIRINDKIIVSKDREYNPDLDSLGFPEWGYFNKVNYIHPVFNKPYVSVNTSRGCVHNCIFCVASLFYGKKVRYRSIESIIDELENHVIGRFGIRHVWFYADDFTHSPEYVKELCRAIIDRKIKITWWSNTRVDKLDETMYRLMKEAGCSMLSIGGESGNAQILKAIKKGTRPEYIKETVKVLRNVGINSLLYFLIGLPGETRQTIQETVNFAKEINPDYVEFYPATPYPGTEFYDIACAENLIVDSNWDSYMCGGDRFVIEIPGVKKEELDGILRRAYREFYFRPSYAWVLFKRAIRPVEFIRLLNFGLGYFRRFFTPFY